MDFFRFFVFYYNIIIIIIVIIDVTLCLSNYHMIAHGNGLRGVKTFSTLFNDQVDLYTSFEIVSSTINVNVLYTFLYHCLCISYKQ